MKNINYVINGVLAVAVIILFVLQFSGKKDSNDTGITRTAGEIVEGQLPIAYVNMDSLLMNYNYYIDMTEVLMKKEENYRANLNQKGNSLRTEVADFEKKINNNAFLTRERAEQEQQRLMKKQQELQDLEAQYQNEMYVEQQKVLVELRDQLVSQLKVYNQDKGYQVVFSNTGDNILIAEQVYDITKEVIDHLNKHYSQSK